MSWFTLDMAGTMLQGWDGLHGHPVIFQHGLGGDEAQVAEVFPDAENIRRLTLECRGQGNSEVGDPSKFSLANFAEDIIGFVDQRRVDRFVIGGISMGAALALRIAVKFPGRVMALILSRPAWGWDKAPPNMQVFVELAEHLTRGTRANFDATGTAKRFAKEAPDNLASLRKFFDRPDLATTAKLLIAIANDGPGITERDVRSIRVPTLVIGTEIDLVHPISTARELAAIIPAARFAEITPKAIDRQRHAAECRAAISGFLQREGRQT